MRPLYWVVSGLLVLFHNLWSPVFGPDSGWTWALSIVSLVLVFGMLFAGVLLGRRRGQPAAAEGA